MFLIVLRILISSRVKLYSEKFESMKSNDKKIKYWGNNIQIPGVWLVIIDTLLVAG